jgi:protein TIF31
MPNKFTQCYESINYSSFNPVPATRLIVGDLFYLTVKTLDKGERGITCCTNGFYVNNNVEKGVFNPLPANKGAYSYTLIGCLNQISPVFGKNMENYINQILETEQYFLTEPNNKINRWAAFISSRHSSSN